MAKWIRHRPEGSSDETEKEVADFLAKLPSSWIIRWGYFYIDSSGVEREGDFLLLSPEGEVLVLEVKGGIIRTFAKSGEWENSNNDNPYLQLLAEWSAILRKLQKQSGRRRVPFVRRCLCYPHQTAIDRNLDHYLGIPRSELLDKQQIVDFSQWWNERSRCEAKLDDQAASKQLFCEAFASGISPKAQAHFLDETDRILERHTEHEFLLLEQLRDNRQLLIQGGTGCGKTSLAIEQARRWAAQNQRVLFLCYNLPLEDQLNQLITRHKPTNGSIEVRSFESLAKELCPMVKQPFLKDATAPERKASDLLFFEQTLPLALKRAVSASNFAPSFDALVVDEAQDHNTVDSFLEAPAWWSIYTRLLKGGWEAPIAVFYDAAQRLPWRNGKFEIADLDNFLLSPVRVCLNRPLRYTRNILAYLETLRSAETERLVDGIKGWKSAPIGPQVEVQESSSDIHEINLVNDTISRWRKEGLCPPADVLVLHPGRSDSPKWTRTETNLLDPRFPSTLGRASSLSMHRAKGLEARAVIVVSVGSFEELGGLAGEQHAFFLACSRARQLLAVISRRSSPAPPTLSC